jgi:hypothetical protein
LYAHNICFNETKLLEKGWAMACELKQSRVAVYALVELQVLEQSTFGSQSK